MLKIKVEVEVSQSCPTLCDLIDCSPARLLHGVCQIRILELSFPFLGDLPDPRMQPASPSFAGRFLNH